jgi:hypothetical protein
MIGHSPEHRTGGRLRMMRLAMLLTGLVALAAPNLAMAAVEMPHGEPSCAKAKDGKTYCSVSVTLKGGIDEAMTVDLKRRLQEVPGTVSSLYVHLDSPGGMVGSAMDIGRLLRSRKASVAVLSRDRCASACALIYASGVFRAATGKIGIHRPYLEVGAQARTMAEIQSVMDSMLTQIREYLREMNVDPRLADEMMRTPPEQVRWLTRVNLDAYGLGYFDPVYREEEDLDEARQLGITRQKYIQRESSYGIFADLRPRHEQLPDGRRVYTDPDGSRYEGEFRDRRRTGHGVYTSPDGTRYEGELHDGEANGWGRYTSPSGDTFSGVWREGCFRDVTNRRFWVGVDEASCR